MMMKRQSNKELYDLISRIIQHFFFSLPPCMHFNEVVVMINIQSRFIGSELILTYDLPPILSFYSLVSCSLQYCLLQDS